MLMHLTIPWVREAFTAVNLQASTSLLVFRNSIILVRWHLVQGV